VLAQAPLTLALTQAEEARAPVLQEPALPEPAPEVDNPQEALLGLQPQKADRDLRRDVAKKMERLERRTQRALVELARREEEARLVA